MKKLILLLIITVMLISCSSKKEPREASLTFDLYGTSELVILNSSTDSIRVFSINYPLIFGGVQSFDSTIAINDSVTFTLKTQGYNYSTLVINDVYYRIFSAPNTVIKAEVISDSVISFIGAFDSINNYLTNSSGTHYSSNLDLMDLVNLTGNLKLTYQELMHENDLLIQKHQDLLIKNKVYLPGWYIDLEAKRLAVFGAYFKLNSLSYRQSIYNLEDHIPMDYVDSIVLGVPYQDERLMGFAAVQHFFYDYSIQSFNPLNDSSSHRFKENYIDSLYAHIIHTIPKPFNDYALVNKLSMDLRHKKRNFDPEWIELISDTLYKNFLYKKLRTEEVLHIGAPAPTFTLLDIDSAEFSFSKIKDSIVLINFWASYCKPCIQNFEHENELVVQFQNKPVKIINICIESGFDTFKALVKTHKLQTFNLFANKKMSDQLKKEYDVTGIPHSVLIDKNGLVVKNKCSVRGDGIVADIKALLK